MLLGKEVMSSENPVRGKASGKPLQTKDKLCLHKYKETPAFRRFFMEILA
jgi:hypothetical protein